jgi:hypothetical protein
MMVTLITARNRRARASTSVAVFATVLTLHVGLGLFIGVHGWDDGSITLAFARTFAESGRIALTPSSEVVEGFSSPFWFLLLTATDVVLPLDFQGMITASQLWSGLAAAVGALLLFRLLPTPGLQAALISILVFCYGPFLNETVNGMEMTALSVLVLAIAWQFRSDDPSATIRLALLGAAAPWIRLEAGGYVALAAVVTMLLARDRHRALALLIGVAASLVVLTAVRLAIFDALLPNTMYAKQASPYSAGSMAERLQNSKTVIKEILLVSAPAVVIAALALIDPAARSKAVVRQAVARLRDRDVNPLVAFAVGYFAAVAALNLLIGPNWGYLGRMEQSLIALGVVAVAATLPVEWRGSAMPLKAVAFAAVLLMLTSYGLDKVRFQERADPSARITITPGEYRETGEAMDGIRVRLGLPTLKAMTPDVGGTSLCCPNLSIEDLGLLSNVRLAHGGWEEMSSYLSDTAPDVIETHSVWSEASTLYQIDYFRSNYVPVVVRDIWFYLRNDHLAALRDDCSAVPPDAVRAVRYRGADIDEGYIRSLGLTQVCRLR